MAHTSEEIPLPGGVTIEFDHLIKAARAGKSPEDCVKAAIVEPAPAPAPEAGDPLPAPAATTSEKE